MSAPKQYFTRAELRQGGRTGAVAKLLMKTIHEDAGHALIWTLFSPDTQERPFLYRRITPESFLILSSLPPNDETGLWNLETKSYAPELESGDRLSFSLIANATVSRPPASESERASRKRGQRVGLVTRARERDEPLDELARAWLATRLERVGTRLKGDRCTIGFDPKCAIRTSNGARVTFIPARFEGVLTVEAPERFLTALYDGFGRSRGYGFGLMLIRRAA